jgi:WhiB family redox-sensing transcriptional regulator
MSKNRANHADHDERDSKALHLDANGPAVADAEERLTGAAERLEWVRPASDDALGAAIVRAGSCMDTLPNGDRPGWLFDSETDPGVAARVCAGCPVQDECLELELRLFGAQKLGMWGVLGEGNRRALHPIWAHLREHAIDRDGTGHGGDR